MQNQSLWRLIKHMRYFYNFIFNKLTVLMYRCLGYSYCQILPEGNFLIKKELLMIV
jgi:hypothetical protein